MAPAVESMRGGIPEKPIRNVRDFGVGLVPSPHATDARAVDTSTTLRSLISRI
jgi:hypothetical protein